MRKRKKFDLPYKAYKGEYYPIIKMILKGPSGPLETEAYVDTGASVSIFLARIADPLGINYRRGKMRNVMVGDGNFIPVYFHSVPIKLGNVSFKATIGFSDQLGADFNLLGQKDIFDRFKVTFDKRKKLISFQPY